MDDTQMLECTQALADDVWDDLETSKPKLVAVLEVGDTCHDVFEGETKIGRDPATCNIIINKPVLSKEHAVLEVEGSVHMIADLGSRNKTRIGKMLLKPHVRYALRGGEELRFGDVLSKYFVKSSDEGESDTCSESMLDATDPGSPRIGGFHVPETPEDSKIKVSEGLKVPKDNVIPESPSASQSTPLPSKGQPVLENKKPPDISAIKLPDLSAIEEDRDDDDDSFFFVSTQPKKSPNIKGKVNTDTNKNNVQKEEDIDSDASTDVELESEKEQNIKSGNFAQVDKKGPKSAEISKEKKILNRGSDDKQVNNIVTVNLTKDKNDLCEEGYNSEASTDIEEDGDGIIESKNEKQVCNNEQENTNSTRNNKTINCDVKSKALPEDIFNQPTQEFPLEIEEGTQVAEAFGLHNKTAPNDASYALGDNTQDILEAFSCSTSKASPKGRATVGKNIFDLPTQVFSGGEDADQMTQPYKNEEKTFHGAGQDAEDDDYVPTQLFLDDSDSKAFKMPFSVSPAVPGSSKRNHKNKNDKREVLSEFGEELFDQPTQKFDDIRDLAEEATQLFQDQSLGEPSCNETSVEASVEKIQQKSEKTCHTEETSPVKEIKSGDSLNKPTAINFHEDSDTDIDDDDDDLAPTQKFSPQPKPKQDSDAVPKLRKDNSNKSTKGDDDDDDDLPPTQVFPTKPLSGHKISPCSNAPIFTPPKGLPATSPHRITKEKGNTPMRVYSPKCKTNINEEEEDQDDLAPTQIFTPKDTTINVAEKSNKHDDDLLPTQVFSPKPETRAMKEKLCDDEDDLIPTQMFSPKPKATVLKEKLQGDDEDDLIPTQVFTPEKIVVKEKLHEDDQDSLMPTQVFSAKTPTKEKVNKTNEYNEDSDTDIEDDFTPLQGSPKSSAVKPDKEASNKRNVSIPTQVVPVKPEATVLKEKLQDDEDDLMPTQVFSHKSATTVVKENLHEDDEDDLMPTQVFSAKVHTKEKAIKTNEYNEDSDTDIDDDPLQGLPNKQDKERSNKQERQLVVTDEGESFCNPSDNSDGELAPTQELTTTSVKNPKSTKPSKDQEEEDILPTQVFQEKVLQSTPAKSEYSKRDSSCTDMGLKLLPTEINEKHSTFATPERPATSRVHGTKENKGLLETGNMKEISQEAAVEDDDDDDLAPTQIFTAPDRPSKEGEEGDVNDCDATQELTMDIPPVSLDESLVRAFSTPQKAKEVETDMKNMQELPVEDDNCSDTSETLLQNVDIDPDVDEVTVKNTTGEENLIQERRMSEQDTMILSPSCEEEGKAAESRNHLSDPCGSSTPNKSRLDFDGGSAGFIPCGKEVPEDVMEMDHKDSEKKRGNSLSGFFYQKNVLDQGKKTRFRFVTKGNVINRRTLMRKEEEDEGNNSFDFLDISDTMGNEDSENEEPFIKSQILFDLPIEIAQDDEHDYKKSNDNTSEKSVIIGRKEEQDASTVQAQTSSEIESKKTKENDADSKTESGKHVQDSDESHACKEPDSKNLINKPEENYSESKDRKSVESDPNRRSCKTDSKKDDKKSSKSEPKNSRSKSPKPDSENSSGKLPDKSVSDKSDKSSEKKSGSESKSRRLREKSKKTSVHEESKNKNKKSHEESKKRSSLEEPNKSSLQEEPESRNKSRRSHRLSDTKNESRKLPEESHSSKNMKKDTGMDSSKSTKSSEKSDSATRTRSQEEANSRKESRRSNDKSDSKNKKRTPEESDSKKSDRNLPEKSDTKNRNMELNKAEPTAKSEKQSGNDKLGEKLSHRTSRTRDIKNENKADRSPKQEQKPDVAVGKSAGFSGFEQSPNMKRRRTLEKLKENVKAEEESIMAEDQLQHVKKKQSKDQVLPKTEVDAPSSAAEAASGSSRKSRRTQPSHETDSSGVIESNSESLISDRKTRKSVAGDEDDDPDTKKRRKKHEKDVDTSCVGKCRNRKKEDSSSEEDVSGKRSGTSSVPPRQHRSRRGKENLSMVTSMSTDNEAEICTTKASTQDSSQTDLAIEPLSNVQQFDKPRGRSQRNSRKLSSDESTEVKTSTEQMKDSEKINKKIAKAIETSTSRTRRSGITGTGESHVNSNEINQENSREPKAEKRKSRGRPKTEKEATKQEHTEEVQSTGSQSSQESLATEVKRRRRMQGELHVIKEDTTHETLQTKSTEECSQPKQRGRRSMRSSTIDCSQSEEEEEIKTRRGRPGKVPRMSVIYESPCTPKSSRKRSSSQSSTGSDMSTDSKKFCGEEEPCVTRTSRSSRSSQRSGKDSPIHHKDTILWSPGQRQYQASTKPRVMFTGYTDQADEKIVVDLGGTLVDAAQECTVLVTTNIRRTCKFLSIMGRGQPIVSPKWLVASKLAKNFVDPWKYLVRDAESEKKFSFKLATSLKQAKTRKLFDNLSIHVTPKVKPPPDQMKEIVECAGGEYIDNLPKIASENFFVVSCADDKKKFTKMKQDGFQIVGTEFILTGLLQQKLLADIYKL
ncbi:uncharacterized protein LOC143022575 [Oratosquilla oratoria]|uniref:uncharacterized protein LOC143022575 n=1 Tax=Oratosquilla oratoria TaxID=337810 RepID=UPI003F76848F